MTHTQCAHTPPTESYTAEKKKKMREDRQQGTEASVKQGQHRSLLGK